MTDLKVKGNACYEEPTTFFGELICKFLRPFTTGSSRRNQAVNR